MQRASAYEPTATSCIPSAHLIGTWSAPAKHLTSTESSNRIAHMALPLSALSTDFLATLATLPAT